MDPPPTPVPAKKGRRGRRLLKWGALAALAGLALLLVALAGAWVWLGTAAGNRFIEARIEQAVTASLQEGAFDIGSLDTNLWNRVTLTDVALDDGSGHTVVGAQRVEVRVALLELITGRLRVRTLDGVGLELDLEVDEDGVSSFGRLFGPPHPDAVPTEWQGLPIDLTVDELTLSDSRVRVATPSLELEVVGLAGSASVRTHGVIVKVRDLQLTGQMTSPQPSPLSIGGAASYDGTTASVDRVHVEGLGSAIDLNGALSGLTGDDVVADLRLDVQPLDLGGLDELLDAGLSGAVRGTVSASGPLSALRVVGALDGIEGTRGRVELDGTVDLEDEDLPWSATVRLGELHGEHLVPALRQIVPVLGEELVLDGVLTAAGSGTSWPEGVRVEGTYLGGDQHVFGTDFTGLDGRFSVADGVLSLSTVETDGPLGPLDVNGSVDLADGPIDLRVTGRFAANELSRYGADGLGGTGRLDVGISGDSQAADPVYVVQGRVVVNGFTYYGDVSFDRVVADLTVTARSRGTRVDAQIEAERGSTYGVEIDRVVDRALVVDVPADGPIGVGGSISGTGVRMPQVFDVAAVRGPWSVRVPAQGQPVVTASAEVDTFRLLDLVDGTYGEATIAMEGDQLEFDVRLDRNQGTVAETQGSFDTARSTLRLSTLTLQPVPGRRYWLERPASLVLTDDGGVRDADVVLAGDGERLVVQGRLGTAGALDATVQARTFDLGLVADLFPDSLAWLSGRLDLDLGVGGDASAARLTGTVDATGTFARGYDTVVGVAGSFDGDGRSMAIDLSASLDGAPALVARGDLPLRMDLSAPGLDPDGRIGMELELRAGDLARFQPFVESRLPAGRVSGALSAVGPIRDPDLDLGAVIEAVVPGLARPVRNEVGVFRRGAQLTLALDVLDGLQRRAAIDASATTRLNTVIAWALGEGAEPDLSDLALWVNGMVVDAELLGLPVESILALSGSSVDVGGSIAGHVRVGGSPNTPVVAADLDWNSASIGDVLLDGGRLELVPGDAGYEVDFRLLFPDGHILVFGDVPVYLDLRKDPSSWAIGRLDLTVSSNDIPLAVAGALMASVSVVSGRMTLDGTVTGTVVDPKPELVFALSEGEVVYQPLAVRYRDLAVTVRATKRRVDLERLVAYASPARGVVRLGFDERPSVTATGFVRLDDWVPGTVEGEVLLHRWWASATTDERLRLTGDLVAGGTWPDLEITGDLALDEGFVRLDAAAFLQMAPLSVDSRVAIHRSGVERHPAQADSGPGLYERLRVDVQANLARQLELEVQFPFLTTYGQIGASLTTADMEVRLDGAVDATLRDGELNVTGGVDVLEGTVKVLRSNFDLRGGTVTFLGDPSNPLLDLTARMEVGTTYLDMFIQGTAAAPEISFSSPDYSDDSQILTMLVTGTEPQNLSSDQGIAAGDLLFTLAVNTLTGGLRGFSIDPDGTVRISTSVSGIRVEVVANLYGDTDDNRYAVEFEVPLRRKLVLDGSIGDVEQWMDLFFEIRF